MTPSLPRAPQIGSRQAVEALRKLAAEVGGLKAFEPGVREAIGNTNWTVLMQRLDEAEAALSRTTQAPVAVKALEWEPDHGIAGLGPYRLFQAQTPLGRYVYGTDAEGNSYWHSSSSGVFMTGDEATAKRLAEAAWEKTARAEAGKFIVLPTLASSDPTPATEAGGDEIAAPVSHGGEHG